MNSKAFFIFLFSLVACTITANAENKPTILQQSDNGLIFRLTFQAPAQDTIQIAGQNLVRFQFQEQTGVFNYKNQLYPELTTVIAVPPVERPVNVTLVNAQWRSCGSRLPLQSAVQDQQSNNQISTTSIAATGWMRHTRLAQIRTIPLRFYQGEWQYLSQAEIQVNWASFQQSASDAIAETNYLPNAILNKSDMQRFTQRQAAKPALRKSLQTERQFIRMEVESNGIYRISGAMLTQTGVAISSLDPAQIRMYNGGSRTLPEVVTAERPQSLIEIPILVQDGGDGQINNTDTILFFGRSVNDWEYSGSLNQWVHYTNPYETKNVYWLSWDAQSSPALRLEAETANGSDPVQHGLHLHSVENDRIKLFDSGRNWFDSPLSVGDFENLNFTFINPHRSSAQVRLRIVADNAGSPNTFGLRLNNSTEKVFSYTSPSRHTEGYIRIGSTVQSFSQMGTETAGTNTLQLQFKSTTGTAANYLDWLELIITDSLHAQNGELIFADNPSSFQRTFSASGFNSEPVVLEISSATMPRRLAVQGVGNSWQFTDGLIDTTARRYFAATSFKEPLSLSKYSYSNLRDATNRADMIIVSPALFLSEANRLAAHKSSARGFETKVVDIATIMEEFGWGLNDPTALRDFVAYAFQNWATSPRFVLLFGDGTYDYRNIGSAGTYNHILTYQTTETSELDNRNIESYFTYVSGNDRIMDLAIGRATVQTVEEAASFVDKIIQYEVNPELGIWRNTMTMVADDEYVTNGTPSLDDLRLHTPQAESIMQSDIPDFLIQQKIYLTNYRAVRSSAVLGLRKPDAQRALIDAINTGSLLINYVGHGNPTLWSHERIFLQNEDLTKIDNGAKQAFFVAATCDFGRFDDPDRQSFTEELLRLENGGAIGFLTASRVVYSHQNAQINSEFYDQMFVSEHNLISVGEAVRLARIVTNNITNDEKYTIIGDPSLILAAPPSIARVSSVNPDTLLSLNTTALAGDLFLGTGERIETPGQVDVLVYDDERDVTYVSDLNASISYTMPGNMLFRGKGSVENGRFNMSFIVPKDITYGGDNASVKIYGYGSNWEVAGSIGGLPASLSSAQLQDSEGPEIEINFSGRESFSNGDPVPANAMISATLRDALSGINVTGEVGHKITLTVDDNTENQYDLTQDFVYFENDHLAGKVVAQLPELTVGFHTAEMKAWDNSNNSAKLSFDFQITEAGELVLREVLNYPNPFTDNTTFTFLLNADAEVDIAVYTVSGRKIRKMENIAGTAGYNEVFWDGLDEDGDRLGNGIYLYRIKAKAEIDGKTERTEFIGKAAINY
ncbi:MAG: type IX secretion system sortase PorU [Deferribacteres bacterium]|nr:type IX secretion system sortase PorU [Deferribacteres bacterium]